MDAQEELLATYDKRTALVTDVEVPKGALTAQSICDLKNWAYGDADAVEQRLDVSYDGGATWSLLVASVIEKNAMRKVRDKDGNLTLVPYDQGWVARPMDEAKDRMIREIITPLKKNGSRI